MKFNKESILYVTVFTFIVCVFFVIFLSLANQVTLAQVKANQNYASHYAVLKALGLADATTSKADVESIFSAQVKELPARDDGLFVFTAIIEGSPFVAVKITNPGLWGPITAIVAADPATDRIRGLEILDQLETPGLGGRIGEAWFTDQFKGEKVGPDGSVQVTQGSGTGDQDKENFRLDAVTGASRTSDFVKGLVNKALAVIRETGGSL